VQNGKKYEKNSTPSSACGKETGQNRKRRPRKEDGVITGGEKRAELTGKIKKESLLRLCRQRHEPKLFWETQPI